MTSFWQNILDTHLSRRNFPSPQEVEHFVINLLNSLFPDYSSERFNDKHHFSHYVDDVRRQLDTLLSNAGTAGVTDAFFEMLPTIYERINEDIDAMVEGDPAARNRREVIRTYPGFFAIAAYRIAHQLHLLGVEGVPRMITELAHGRTGIDIHPAARIGRHFCIDHGTGIVIGETCVIGDYVKLYQGVTLGALSVNKEDAQKKRHPTIGDHVIVYAGATILGGETVVGHHSVVGGNVWLTRTIPPYSKVYYHSSVGASYEADKVVIKSDV